MGEELEAGAVIGNHRLESLLGRGGQAVVWVVWQFALRVRRALKILRPELGDHPQVRERFLQEARVVAGLGDDAPSTIVRVHECGEYNGYACISMELVPGDPLSRTIAACKNAHTFIPIRTVIHIALQVCKALSFAHDKGVLHRDLKPANLIVIPDPIEPTLPAVKVVDFGLCLLLPTNDPTLSTPLLITTADDVLAGTLLYMSPEQKLRLPLDHRTDIYSLGLVIHEMLCNELPSFGFGPLKRLNPDTPEGLREILERCLEWDRTRRASTIPKRSAWGEGHSGSLKPLFVAGYRPPLRPVGRFPSFILSAGFVLNSFRLQGRGESRHPYLDVGSETVSSEA